MGPPPAPAAGSRRRSTLTKGTPVLADLPSRDLDAFLAERELQDVVPLALELLRHRDLVCAIVARNLRGLLVARHLREPLQELVRGDLDVLGGVPVARVLARVLA